jgi:hypothetical protein
MKARKGFIANSSTCYFTCVSCGEGYDAEYNSCSECNNGHIYCEACKEDVDIVDDYVTRETCECCSLRSLAEQDFHDLLEALTGLDIYEAGKFLKEKRIDNIEELYKLINKLRKDRKNTRVVIEEVTPEIKSKKKPLKFNIRRVENDKKQKRSNKKRNKACEVREL